MLRTLNHPKKGSSIEVSPITDLIAIEAIKKRLEKKPRDYALFVVGINTPFKARELLALKVSDVKHLKSGDEMVLKEHRHKKSININNAAYSAIQGLLKTLPEDNNDWLFRSEKTGQPLNIPSLNGLVKKWCCKVPSLRGGNYGSASLRKTFGYMFYTIFYVNITTLNDMFKHSSPKSTFVYYGIQRETYSG